MEASLAPAIRVLADWIGSPALWAALLAIGVAGEVVKRLVGKTAGKRGWRGVFEVTMPLHPMLVGAALGFVPGLPVPASFGTSVGGAVLFYVSAGVGAAIGYDVVKRGAVKALQRFAGVLGGGSGSA